MICTAASHRGAIKMFLVQFWVASMLSISIYANGLLCSRIHPQTQLIAQWVLEDHCALWVIFFPKKVKPRCQIRKKERKQTEGKQPISFKRKVMARDLAWSIFALSKKIVFSQMVQNMAQERKGAHTECLYFGTRILCYTPASFVCIKECECVCVGRGFRWWRGISLGFISALATIRLQRFLQEHATSP